MGTRFGPVSLVRDRFQWISYGFLVGVLLGLILGWFFHGAVSVFLRFGVVLLLLAPLVIGFIVWRRLSNRNDDDEVAVVERRFVVETRADERPPR